VTGNEDGVKHCAMNILYSLQHLGYVIPPQADAGWIGEAGPGPSYLDEGSGGPENDFTNRNTTFMTWNLLHSARLLKDAGGFPAHGNQRSAWDAGCRFGLPEPRVPLAAFPQALLSGGGCDERVPFIRQSITAVWGAIRLESSRIAVRTGGGASVRECCMGRRFGEPVADVHRARCLNETRR